MIEWRDDAVLLSARNHGETAAIVSVFSRTRGRCRGLVPGGMGKRLRPNLQCGNILEVVWKARLDDHLGTFSCELMTPHAARVLHDYARLSCLNAVCSLIETLLPERESHEALFIATLTMLDGLSGPVWSSIYAHWELALLRAIGYGLDLSRCAAGGESDDLAYVSPRSACAVSRKAGSPYHDRLLVLPVFLLTGEPGKTTDVLAALRLSGYFLDRFLRTHHSAALPLARQRLLERLAAQA